MNLDRPNWQQRAACRGVGPDIFYSTSRGDASKARTMCAECEVSTECTQYAIENADVYGVWGGMNYKDRREISDRPVGVRRFVAVCGTEAGYTAHLRRSEPTCRHCRWAHSEYQRIKTLDSRWQAAEDEGERGVTPYYDEDGITIYHGDCREILTTLNFGMALIDPPYSMSPNSVRGRDDGAAGAIGSPMMLLCEVLDAVRDRMDVGGIAPLICDWRRVPDVSYLATRTGLRIATTVAWTRTTVGTGGLFRSAWDPVLVLSNGTPDAIDRAAIPNTICANPPGRRTHPYEKPVELWAHFTQRQTPRTVVEPFMGSAAGAVAAARHGHNYIGIEVDERYCEMAATRLSSVLDFGGAA